jgi:hypothetical protein
MLKLIDAMVKQQEFVAAYNFVDDAAWKNKANWYTVPIGVTNYNFIGNVVIETDYYYYLFHTDRLNSPMMFPKYQNNIPFPNGNLYGSENYGYSTDISNTPNMHLNTIQILTNTDSEITLRVDAGGFGSTSQPNVNILNHTFKTNYIDISPGNSKSYALALHSGVGGFGIGVANIESDNDFLISPYDDSIVTNLSGRTSKQSDANFDPVTCPLTTYPYNNIYHGCDGTSKTVPGTANKFLLQLSTMLYGNSNYNIMFMIMNKDQSKGKSEILSSYHRDCPKDCWYSIEVLGVGDIIPATQNANTYIGMLPFSNSFYWEMINNSSPSYTVSWIPTIPGKYRMTGKYETGVGTFIYKTITTTTNNFTLTNPGGALKAVVIYLYDRIPNTPTNIVTAMDIYNSVINQNVCPTPQYNYLIT